MSCVAHPSYLQTHEAPRQLSDLTLRNCLRYAFYPSEDEWRFEAPSGELVSVKANGTVVTTSADTLRHLESFTF